MARSRESVAPTAGRRALRAAAAAAIATALLLIGDIAVAASAPASASSDGGTWATLAPAERQALAPLQADWNTLGPDSRRKWLGVAQRYPRLSPQEQERLHSRMGEWAKLSPEQRGQTRLGFKQAQQLSPEERQARWKAYQALPPERRRELAEERHRTPPAPVDRGAQAKSNVVLNPPDHRGPKSVGATLVQGRTGATTSLISKPAAAPKHQHAGLPKIAATPTLVDRATLLPRRGLQGAAVAPAGSAPPAAPPRSPPLPASSR